MKTSHRQLTTKAFRDTFTVYVALPGYEALLLQQLSDVVAIYGNIIVSSGSPRDIYWVHNVWFEARYTEAVSNHGRQSLSKINTTQLAWVLL